jgi:hypothetical protein
MKTRLILIALLFLPLSGFAGNKNMTGNVRVDLCAAGEMIQDTLPVPSTILLRDINQPERKNPFMGGLYSLILPGAGEYYAESYWKGAIALAIEVTAITAAVVYTDKGDTKTNQFQQYADGNWSVVKYAQWIMAHGVAQYGGPQPGTLLRPNFNDNSIPPWERVYWDSIITWEKSLHPNGGFSHTLPIHGEQQYYELIGKYAQYKFGWNTYPVDNNGVPIADPDYYNYIPAEMKSYAADRGKANDYYYLAGVATSALVVNHLLSAVDAYFSTMGYNAELESKINVGWQEQGAQRALITTLSVRLRF